ncbi:TetR/AcrR family transcriptional regulator [Marivita sp. S6314]|uniref:TetR/AcrR family transcriptional regulator n=1 Tax=Marivita sp. S6314 TaxID=2926406 RepID=UPI001FF381D2|nr:TetR/AcrR family transcriptional regulator [Marivita sp. S6314]MCK0150262.1 TetR/AcrR family transcriptional regulator [Marivita sp. S6314]
MKKPRFTKDNWLDHGHEQLSLHGPEALKLDAICDSAGRTKGSFYHHFPDHPTFLKGIIEHWIARHTDALIEAIPDSLPAATKDEMLTELAIGIDYRLEIGIRELARRDASVAGLVANADRRRLAFLAEIYVDRYAISKADASFAAQIEYAAYIGTILTRPDMNATDQAEFAERFQKILHAYFAPEASE